MLESIPPNSQLKITFGDAQKLLDDYRRLPLMANPKRDALKLWADNFAKTPSVSIESLEQLPELQEKWTQYSNYFVLRLQESGEAEVSQSVFITAYQQFNPSNSVSLGKMFDCVFDNLALSKDEYRMYASTDAKLGQTKITPSSTQTDRQTLVVAHLSRPVLPAISRDFNSLKDLTVSSDLDVKDEQKSLELFK